MLARDSLVQAGLPDNPYARQLRNGFRWLRFEKELESEFREFLSWNSLMQRRAAIGVALLIWALFILADWLMVDIRQHPSLLEQLLGVRLGMIGLLLVVWPAAFMPSLRRVGDVIAPYCLLLINLAVLACDVLFEWHGVPRFTQLGATLGILAVFFPLGLAFWTCVRLALLCLTLNLAVFLLFGGEENLRTNLLNTLYNGLVVLICSFALYLQDYAQREQFLGRRLLGMMAEQDSLTGLVNRRYYELLAQRALEQGTREGKGVALILVDVDDFKAYNDHYGHPAGDAALHRLGAVLRQGGGDEDRLVPQRALGHRPDHRQFAVGVDPGDLLGVQRQVVAEDTGGLLRGDLGHQRDVVEHRGDVVEEGEEAGSGHLGVSLQVVGGEGRLFDNVTMPANRGPLRLKQAISTGSSGFAPWAARIRGCSPPLKQVVTE